MFIKVCYALSVLVLIIGTFLSFHLMKNKKVKRVFNAFNCFAVSVFSSAVIIFLPIYYKIFDGDKLRIIKTVLLSIHNTIRLFIVDGEFTIITDYIPRTDIFEAYTFLSAVLFVLAPILTFGVVLSILKNIFTYQKYLLNYNSEVYIFSELNEKSLALANSLYAKNPKRLIVFNDTFEKNEEETYELIEKAKKLNSICFKQDITAVNFNVHNKKKKILFFLIGHDDTENIEQCVTLLDTYKNRDNTHIYIFSNSLESEFMLSSCDKGKIKLRRINDTETLIFRNLYNEGYRLFENAVPIENVKKITAVIVGMGNYGQEMIKALSWFCQMDGYKSYIYSFDRKINAEVEFKSLCPELLDDEHNGNFEDDGESQYSINIFSGYDVNDESFDEKILSINDASYILVALGNDELNIKTAYKLRRLYEKKGLHPQIQTVVYNNKKKKAIINATNFKGQKLDVEIIGDLESSYSEDVILESDIETLALERHKKWGDEESFWSYEYNYRSSIASVIHRKMKILCKMPGIDKPVDKRSEQEKSVLRKLEHRRWNAYMRAEGYSYSEIRDDLAKVHNCLVTFDDLSEKDKLKDDD